MDNQKYNNRFSKDERKKTDELNELINSNEDDFIFVPAKKIQVINKIIDNLEEVKLRMAIIKSIILPLSFCLILHFRD